MIKEKEIKKIIAVMGKNTMKAAGYAGCKIYEYWQEKSQGRMEAHKAKEGKQKDGCPQNNEAQNDQFKGAVKEIEKKLGRKLKDTEWEQLHRDVSGENQGYHDIVEIGLELFKKR